MTRVQGDFGSVERAQQAKASLIQSGVAAARIRVWNILPDRGPGQSGGGVVTTGAIIGGLLGGGGGLVAGAALGASYDNAGEDKHLPLPVGARVVVDAAQNVEGDAEHLLVLLRGAGAANTHQGAAD